MKAIYVFGHRNPDNDSICSAVAYAHLKNEVDPDNFYKPARLGPAPKETQWAFERFGLELPQEISHIHTRVIDVMTADVATVNVQDSMLKAGRIMRSQNLRALPVVDDDNKVLGLLSQHRLAILYLEEKEISSFKNYPTTVELIAEAVSGEIIVGDAQKVIDGDVHIGAAEPETVVDTVNPGDVLIVSNRVRTQPMAIKDGAAVLVITMGKMPAPEVIELAREKGCALILTDAHTYEAARRVSLANSVGDIMERELSLTTSETLLSEAKEDLLASAHRELVVVDEDHRVAGILTRTDVARGTRRPVVLVDHNESSQSAPGIEEAAVIEIVDHHRVGDIQSSGPILFLCLPVGATATIVALQYFELGVEMPQGIAGILLSALLTDTVLLKSPTTTQTDREVCDRLSKMLGLDYLEYGMELFASKQEGKQFLASETVRTDLKEFRVGDSTIAIAQHEMLSISDFMAHKEAVVAEMETLLSEKNYDAVVLMATDIVAEGSQIFVVGKKRLAERAFDTSFEEGSVWMDGVLSRKKQVASRFMESGS